MIVLQVGDHVMRRSRYNEEQIAFALKQAELGTLIHPIDSRRLLRE